jgi:hypothetical protein
MTESESLQRLQKSLDLALIALEWYATEAMKVT